MNPAAAASRRTASAALQTKDRILDAAEKLFSLYGFDAASVRMIAAAAKVNLAAINYHFQSKEALLLAVYERRVAPINARRVELLRSYLKGSVGRPLKSEPILEAFLRPAIEILDEAPHIPMLMVRTVYLQDRETFREIFDALFRPVSLEFFEALRLALPHLSGPQLFLRMQFFLGSFLQMMAARRAMEGLQGFPELPAPEEMMRQLIHYTAAGLRVRALESSK
ncbi:MAG: TetR family transcriptional regulator [Bryobacteraceae bacterium]|nr:TetR family transcriptional regulator [Bryobacteraceae bacterium]MDW8379228.1 TetR/AcrR family transcriptional regulator [Bryobacterales bacterium]